MKYIRTYDDYNSWKLDYSNPDRGSRLTPTLYRYPYTGYEDAILLELDDPRKHGDSTYMRIYIESDTNFSFYIGNKPGDTQTTMTCTIDWGDGTVETKTITKDNYGFKLSHSYTGRNFRDIELYNVERDYSIVGDAANHKSLISHPSIVKKVILGNSVVNIGVSAFEKCPSITSVHIPNSVTSIDAGAFDECTSLTSIYIPESVTSIGDAFYGCTSLTSIYIPESVTSIGEYTFEGCTSLTSIYIPESITTIEDGMLRDCTSLTSVYIPKSVTLIDYEAFLGCTSLTSVHIPEEVTYIGDGAFEGCSSLKLVNIPKSVTRTKRRMFRDCTSLTSIDIPESVTYMEGEEFKNCSSLKSVSFYSDEPPYMGGNPFEYLPANGTLHIKRGVINWMWEATLDYFDNWRIVEDL